MNNNAKTPKINKYSTMYIGVDLASKDSKDYSTVVLADKKGVKTLIPLNPPLVNNRRLTMSDLQEQIEQFMKDHWKFDDDYKDTALYNDTHALIRRVVEECCIKAGEPLSLPQRLAVRYRIEDHFAWLLK